MSEEEIIVGIDLGTTNSCVGIWHNGSVKILANSDGLYVTPSYVSYSKDGILVGEPAKKQLLANPQNTVYDMKRVIGKPSIDEMIEKSKRYWTFKITQDKNLKPAVEIKQNDNTKLINPEEVSAEVLKKMKDTAERFTSTEVKKAIITVPAYFNQAQKQATIKAAELAGLEVPELITEPAAAAYAYGFDRQQFDNINLLVVDLGGGTFDVVVVKVNQGLFTVSAISGDTQLGGRDFDTLLFAHLRKMIKEKYDKDCFANNRLQQKLLKEVIDLKHGLTTSNEASLFLGDFFDDIDEELHITRDEFNQICEKLFNKIEKITKDTLEDANLKNTDINEILMIGGSSRMPKVQTIMESIFPGKKLNNSLHPDEAVAYGAAICAAQRNKAKLHEVPKINLQEATPLAYGTDLAGGLFGIFEGVGKFARDNNYLGSLVFDGITPGPATTQIVTLTFKLDANGILTVIAEHNDKKAELEIDFKDGSMAMEGLNQALGHVQLYEDDDDVSVKRVKAKTNLSITLERLRAIAEHENLEKDQKVAFISKCDQISGWLDENTFASEEELKEKLAELQQFVKGHPQIKLDLNLD